LIAPYKIDSRMEMRLMRIFFVCLLRFALLYFLIG
jgi:hypothetical protein